MKKKQSSTISAKTAMEELKKAGYETHTPDPNRVIRPTERNLQRKNAQVEKSKSGKSIMFYYNGASDGVQRAEEVFVPAKGMLSVEQVQTLQKLTKVTFSNLSK
jgi:hypothetical protein